MSLHRRPLIIVGMQRSGTSALSGALAKLGVSFGREEMLYAADANNQQGYFEHRMATILNLRCLSEFQMHPTSFERLPGNWKEYPQAKSLCDELRSFIKDQFSNRGRWAIKQPLTSLVLPLYRDVFAEMRIDPHYLLCVRNPLETMASEADLEFGDAYRVMASLGQSAVGSWLRYTLGSFADTAGGSVTSVAYDTLLTDPEDVLRKIVARHDDWDPTESQWWDAAASIRPGFRHQSTSLEALADYPSIVAETYRTATSFDDSRPEDWDNVLALHRQFEGWRELMSEPAPSAGKLGLAWIDNGAQRIAETRYIPDGKWQTVRLTIDAPPKTTVSGLLYGWPFRAWIRRSVWKADGKESEVPIHPGLGSSLNYEAGFRCLKGVFEPNQITLTTPGAPGPYELQIEFLLETGLSISDEAAAGLARKLDECVTSVEATLRRAKV